MAYKSYKDRLIAVLTRIAEENPKQDIQLEAIHLIMQMGGPRRPKRGAKKLPAVLGSKKE